MWFSCVFRSLGRAWPRRVFWAGVFSLASLAALAQLGKHRLDTASEGRLFDEPGSVPPREVALVLGCAAQLSDGRENLFFRYRMDAAAALYRSGRAKFLLVSGDNHAVGYDEPGAMRAALVERGVPSDRIVRDFAGFSTFDSVVRAKEVFGQESIIVVSQAFHNRRALYIARSIGVDAVAFNARDVDRFNSFRTMVRERLAVVKTVLDLELWGREPRFLGERVLIGQATDRGNG